MGKLFVDYLSPLKVSAFVRNWKKWPVSSPRLTDQEINVSDSLRIIFAGTPGLRSASSDALLLSEQFRLLWRIHSTRIVRQAAATS